MPTVSFMGFLAFLQTSVFVLGYISNNNLFPEPLSKEEEKIYLERLSKGDEEAKNILIERNLRLVAHVCKKYSNTNIDLEDLISIGTIGLIKGIKSFNVEKGARLSTYVSRCIDNEILMYLRKNKKRNADVSLEDSLSYDAEGNELRLEDILGTEPDIVTKELEDSDLKRIMLEEINNLPKRDKEIMKLRYGLFGEDEITQKELAKKLNISQSYISRIEKKVIKKIKDKVNI